MIIRSDCNLAPMCGRYALHANPDVVALQFGLESAPAFKPRYNICPGADILVVTHDGTDQHRWGLIPHWAKDPAIGNKLANARGESIADRGRTKAALVYAPGRRRAFWSRRHHLALERRAQRVPHHDRAELAHAADPRSHAGDRGAAGLRDLARRREPGRRSADELGACISAGAHASVAGEHEGESAGERPRHPAG